MGRGAGFPAGADDRAAGTGRRGCRPRALGRPGPGRLPAAAVDRCAPQDVLDSYAVARDAIHDAPLGESDYRWPRWSPAPGRAAEAEARSQGLEQRVVVAIREGTGEIAGFTEVCVHPRRPDVGYQRDTAVVAAHRGRGLGRCLKAHMLPWLLVDRPALARITTTT